jgi:hypothetical protein
MAVEDGSRPLGRLELAQPAEEALLSKLVQFVVNKTKNVRAHAVTSLRVWIKFDGARSAGGLPRAS